MIWFLLLLLQQVQSSENCSAGFYKSANEECVNCSPGKYQDQPGQTSCKTCDDGQYQNLYTSIACKTCATTEGICSEHRLLCPLGKFNGRLSNNCTKCSPGFFSNDVGRTFCTTCPRGFFQNLEGQSSCTLCPEKTESNSTECLDCPSKWVRHLFTCSDTCPDNTFESDLICESCERGKYVKEGICTECPLGFIKEEDGPIDCSQCPLNYISNQHECEKCSIHRIVDNNECKCIQGYKEESNACIKCSSTEFQDEIGQNSCKACPNNQVSVNNVCAFCTLGNGYVAGECKLCPSGWARQETDDGTCKECAVGRYASNNRCFDCQIGFYQDQIATTECIYCENAKYQNAIGQANCKTCTGTLQTNLIGKGSTFCCEENQCDTDKCGPGRDRSSSNCTECAAGRWSTQNTNCQDCPNGYIADSPESHECKMCTDGQVSNSGNQACETCPAGKYEEGYECKSCPRGKFTSTSEQTSCKDCPFLGTKPQTTNETEQTSNANCSPCSDNWVIKPDGACGDCGQGEFVESYECKTCPTGYFSDDNHQTSCTVCPRGETTLGPGASSCISCIGNDCGCAPGEYGPTCSTCPKGWWSTGGVRCNACTARTYQDEEGQNGCKNCAAGKYSDVMGLGECKICPNGYFQNKDTQGSCFDCPLGRYSLTGYDKECDTCPAGSSTEEENSVSQAQCQHCNAGKYESNGICNECLESFYQDEEGQTTCKSCPDAKWSEPGSTSESEDCFETGTLTTYTFGNMKDQTTSSAFETTCEIRPNFVLLCPACTCNSDSRNGFWDGPLCNECRRGFASRYCTSICPGYNGQDDSTMCNGNGRCWFGRFGNGLCYCGGNHVIDQTAENSFVDVRTCPRGQICPGYGSSAVEKTSYIPQYYIIQYRQFTTFVLQMSKYTPERGHMWFKRYAPSKAYENSCSVCTSKYESSLMTEVGYWANDGAYKIFPPQAQSANGFHGENCQHECALCLNNGYCVHSPHPFYYSYTIKDTFMDKGRLIVPTTACICRSSVFDASHMCCPNGFQPYIYYGSKHTDPYSRFDAVPFITSIDNIQTLSYYRDRDLWLYSQNNKPQYPPVYSEPDSGQFPIAVRSEIRNTNYDEVGPYNKHVYHGTTREICRACPGLFGKGVRAQERLVQTEQEAEDYWWDFSASSGDKKCANQGVCNFYAKESEVDVDFMGNVATWSLLHRGVLCRSDPTFQFQDVETLEECVKYANDEGALFVGFGPEFYKGGSEDQLEETTFQQASSITTEPGWAIKDSLVNGPKYYIVKDNLPIPDSDSEYRIFPNFKGNKCIGYTNCDEYTENSYQYNIYDVTRGRGDDRFSRTSRNVLTQQQVDEEASYDRFDTCFTYTKDNNRAKIDLYTTIGYKQGLDPFIGGLCPRGYFCTQTDDTRELDNMPPVGYKEACPPGYYQPQYGITRTDNNVRCNKGVHNVIYEVSDVVCADTSDTYVRNGHKQIENAEECAAAAEYLRLNFSDTIENYDNPHGCFISETSEIFYGNGQNCTSGCVCRKSTPCQLNTATFKDNDYVDNVCLRCPRHTWSAEGSYECHNCPKGTVKKISGNFNPAEIQVFNMDTIQNDHWYYIPDEIGNENDDCAKVPPAVVHIPGLDTVMKETAQNQQFLPLLTCPYGFSNRPGTYIIQDKWDISNIDATIDFSLPPYVKNNGIESAIVSDVPCDCLLDDNKNGIKYFTPPTPEKCWNYARISGTLPTICTSCYNEGINAENIDTENIFWDGCSKFKHSTTVHYHYTTNQQPTFVKNIPSSLQFICIKKVTNIELTKQITAQYCFACPGDSITGPETGICSTCPGNMVKKNMKLAIQKLVERSYPRLYQCYSGVSGLIENNIIESAKLYVGDTNTAPKDELMKCKTIVRPREDTSIDVEYKENNIQAWQFLIDETTIWKVDSVFWPIIESNDTKVTKLTLSDCVLACSTTWGSILNINRKVRVGIALKESDRNFCLCNDGGSTEAYYRYVGEIQTDVLHQAKYRKNYIDKTTRCDDITNSNDCEYAASVMSHAFAKVLQTEQTEFPHGCFKHENTIYYNTKGMDSCTAGNASGCVCVDKTLSADNYDYNFLSEKSSEKILWYQSQVEEPWNKIRPLCGSCTPGKIFFNSKCQNCAAGQYTSTPEEAMQAKCQNCPIGFYQSDHGKSYCSMCMVGLAINNPQANKCKECQPGYYGNEMGKGQPTEYETGTGTYIKCKECPTGFFQALSKKTSCDECRPGKYQNEMTQTTCKECQPGEYTEQNKQKVCKDCKPGYHNSLFSQPSCKACSPGRYQFLGKSTATECIKCSHNSNTYQNERGQDYCKSCKRNNVYGYVSADFWRTYPHKPNGNLDNGNYYGYSDEEGSIKCKACKGGHQCPPIYHAYGRENGEIWNEQYTKCATGSVNFVQPRTEFTAFGSTCIQCTGRNTANSDATDCKECPVPKKRPTVSNNYLTQSGVECEECPYGKHSVHIDWASGRPICTNCTKMQKIISTGCTDCPPGEVMDPNNDQACTKCTGNTIAKDGTCEQCPEFHTPNSDHTACEYCGGYTWSEMFKGFDNVSDTGSTFQNALDHTKTLQCQNDGPGPRIICYATWEIELISDVGEVCFKAEDIVGDDSVAIYIKQIGTPVSFDCNCQFRGVGCSTFLGVDHNCASSLQWESHHRSVICDRPIFQPSWGDERFAKKGDKLLLVMWFFNEDDGADRQVLNLTMSGSRWVTGNECPS